LPTSTLEQQLIDLLDNRDLTRVSIDAGVDHRGEVHFSAFVHGAGMVGSSGHSGSIHGAVQKAVEALVEKRFGGEVAPMAPIAEAVSA